jgi:outer membrane protein assembly factor BamB
MTTGNTKWTLREQDNQNYWSSSPSTGSQRGLLVVEGTRDVAGGSRDYYQYQLMGINMSTGSIVWTCLVGAGGTDFKVGRIPSPAIWGGKVFGLCSSTWQPNRNAWMVNESTGYMVWSTDESIPDKYFTTSPILAFQTLYFCSENGNLYALDPAIGEILWNLKIGDAMRSYGMAMDTDNRILFIGSDQKLSAFSEIGIKIWQKDFALPITTSPIVGDGKVLISVGNMLYALDESDGREIWSFQAMEDLTSPVVSNGVVYTGSADGHLYALFSAEKITTTLSDPSTSVTYSHLALLSTRLSDENGTAIPNANITFSVYHSGEWNSIGWQATNAQGDASTDYVADLSSGLYDLRVYYAGDFFHNSSYFVGKLTVNKEPTSLTFPISPIEMNYHDMRQISTRIEDDEHNAVVNIDVHYQILVNVSWENIGVNFTDTQGVSNLSYSAQYPPGTYPIRAFFEDSNYYENRTIQTSLEINKENTRLSDPTTTTVYNEVTRIQTTLSDDENLPILGLNVTFHVYRSGQWTLMGYAETNNNGIAETDCFLNLEPDRYQIKATFEGNHLYLGSEYSGSLTVYSRLIIDDAAESKEKSDIGDIQSVYFHTIWQYNSSAVNGGTLHVNDTQVSINATGWAELVVTSSKAAFQEWSITSVDCNGATSFTQTCQNPHITWDTILIVLSTASERVDVGTEIQISINATYAYDGQPFGGQVTLNDTVRRLTWVGRRCYSVYPVVDLVRGLKTCSVVNLTATWDIVEVILETGKDRIDLGQSAPVTISAQYAYDHEPFMGSVVLNDTSLTSSTVTKKFYTTANVTDRFYNVTKFTSNTVGIIWDEVTVTISALQTRIDIGRNASLMVFSFYSYDGNAFGGTVTLNDSSRVSDLPKKTTYTTREIQDPLYGLSHFDTNTVSVIWDEVIVSLSIDGSRITAGETANITRTAKYAFDLQTFLGQIILNDTATMSSVGTKSFAVAKVLDNIYGLSNFTSNIVTVVWDRVRVDCSIENPSLGSAELAIALRSEYDGTPIDYAEVTVGGNRAQNNGNGNYACKLPCWSPILATNIAVGSNGYKLVDLPVGGILNQNFLVEAILIPAVALTTSGFVAYRWRKKRQAYKEELQNLDPAVVEIARKYGGILTKTVLASELKKPLEIAEASLNRLVSKGDAQKISKAGIEVYDIPSVRTILSKVENQIITVLRDSFRGFPKHELIAVTGLTPDVVEESLSRLQKEDIVAFDNTTKEYSLKGVRSGRTKCRNCGALVDVTKEKCPKCGADV